MAEFTGTAGDDSLVGTDRSDVFNFSLGNDTLIGGARDDTLRAAGYDEGVSLPDNIVIDLAAGTLVGAGLTQQLNSIEDIVADGGTNATLRGTEGDNTFVLESTSGMVLEGRDGILTTLNFPPILGGKLF